MDEALLTGRFSVQPDMTRRGMSARSARSEDNDGSKLSREGSARPRSVSRSSSRADTCLRRSRSAFDVELFRRQLRLNKTLSRNRFKQELLDLALHPIVIRASSARAEPEGREFDSVLGSARERFNKERSSLLKDNEVCDSDRKEMPQEDHIVEESGETWIDESHKDTKAQEDEANDPAPGRPEQLDSQRLPGRQTKRSTVIKSAHSRKSTEEEEDEEEDDIEDVEEADKESTTPPNIPPAQKHYTKRARRRRSESNELNVVSTHRADSRRDRTDGAIVIHPRRNRTRYDVTSELMSPRRFALPVRDDLSTSSLLCYSSSSEDEELMNLLGHTPLYPSSERRDGDGGESEERGRRTVGREKFRRRTTTSDSEQFDTDLEVDDGSEFNVKERNQSMPCLDTDFGHLTYETACTQFQVIPRKRIVQQLMTSRLQINYCGLNNLECKALALALLRNSCLDEVDLAFNGMEGESVAYIADTFQRNIFITKLNLSGNRPEEEGSRALGEMLKANTWLTHLGLAECRISDNEIGFLAKGIQENSTVICLNLSKNKIEIHGGRHLGTALGQNNGLECLNLSWNMLRGGGAVAVCNSLQRNHTLRELNLAWNGLGFQGSLAISEALKVNRCLKKLDLSNNRVDWDCTPYLAKALTVNRTLQVLEVGNNPISMDGCMKLLEAIDRPSSSIRLLSLVAVPISNKIAFKATEISKTRDFSMEHGGVISTRDVFGMRRIKREDPLTLLIRYLSTMGIRVVDLFRVFDTNSKLYVSQANFIRGLKRVRAPLDEEDMLRVARRMRSDKRGDISYQELAANVRSHIREERKEDRRQQLLEMKKREERRRILQSDLPLYTPPSFSYMPGLYNMYGSSVFSRYLDTLSSGTGRRYSSRMDSVVSRRGYDTFSLRGKTPSSHFLPRIDTPGMEYWNSSSPFLKPEHQRESPNRRRGVTAAEYSRRSPMTLVRHGTKGLPGSRRPVSLLRSPRDELKDKAGLHISPKLEQTRSKSLTLGAMDTTKPKPGLLERKHLKQGKDLSPRAGIQEKKQNLSFDVKGSSPYAAGTEEKRQVVSSEAKASILKPSTQEQKQSPSRDTKETDPKSWKREKEHLRPTKDRNLKADAHEKKTGLKFSTKDTHLKTGSRDKKRNENQAKQQRKDNAGSVEPKQKLSTDSPTKDSSSVLPPLASTSKNLVAGDLSRDLRSAVDKARHREAVGVASPDKLVDLRSSRGPLGLNGSKRGL